MVVTAPLVNVVRGDTTSFYGYTFSTAGAPDNLSTSTFRAQWRKKEDSTEALELIVDSNRANVGELFVSASAAITAQMDSGGVWDLQLTSAAGVVSTPVRGVTALTKDVTR